jgi:hypothetical protein
MVRKFKINKYKYEFRASEAENVGVLYLMEKKEPVCMAVFTNASELPPPREGLNGVIYTAHPFEWFDKVIDLLRNEKPVYFTWDASAKMARITTDEEPVGEEEHQSLMKFLFGS